MHEGAAATNGGSAPTSRAVVAMRLFFALGLPQPLLTRLERLQSLLRGADADVRWVRPAGMHLTLKFLGEVPLRELTSLERAGQAAATAIAGPLRLALAGTGVFPTLRSPRVVWVGVAGETRRLECLHERLEAELEPLGFAPEPRRFHPHVTLGRVRGRRGVEALAQLVRAHEADGFGSLEVDALRLYESRLSRSGARYDVLDSFPLGGARGGDNAPAAS